MALVLGRYEGLFTLRSHISPGRIVYLKKSYFSRAKPKRNMTSEGKQSFISPYNKGLKLFIIPKLHTTKHFVKLI
jgi:hypothetical protein